MKKLGFGCMRLPEKDKIVDLPVVCQMVDTFLENGFTYFDTAYMYHNFQSEVVVREALVKRHPRDSFTIATKLPTMFLKTPEDQERIFNEQLTKCGVEYFDYYLLHNLNSNTYPTAEQLKSFDFVMKKKEEGYIKQVGFSFHDTPELLDKILNEHPNVDFVQLQINYLDWNNPAVDSKGCYEVALLHEKKIVVMEPVKGGMLANLPEKATQIFKEINPEHSIASWAIRYAASLPNVFMVLSGMSTYSQMEDNIDYMKDFKPLSVIEQDAIKDAIEEIHRSITIPCTSCGYCLDGCPKQIAIPKYFALYNNFMLNGGKNNSSQIPYYRNISAKNGKASDCISCHRCEKSCPQHISIVESLKMVAKAFENS